MSKSPNINEQGLERTTKAFAIKIKTAEGVENDVEKGESVCKKDDIPAKFDFRSKPV